MTVLHIVAAMLMVAAFGAVGLGVLICGFNA